MHGELVFTNTPDHLRLHGFYSAASRPLRMAQAGGCDAAILLHGLGGNFYSSRLLLQAAGWLQELGLATLLANTRGHDMINTSTWNGRAQSVGAALERVSDGAHDIAGWTDWLGKRGHAKVLLVGHSLGAIKSLWTMAHAPLAEVAAMVGLSATRLSHQQLLDSPGGDAFQKTLESCQQLIDQGQGELPIQVPFPFPTWMTPQAYLEKYGPQESYNWLTFIDKVQVPTLLLFGQRELDDNPAFAGLESALAPLRESWNSLEIQVIPDADHFYSGQFDSLRDAIQGWLR